MAQRHRALRVSSDHVDFYLDEFTVRFRPPKVGRASSHLKSICLAGCGESLLQPGLPVASRNLVILWGWAMDMQCRLDAWAVMGTSHLQFPDARWNPPRAIPPQGRLPPDVV